MALVDFGQRRDEATWIAEAVRILVPSEAEGAMHDKRDGSHRGLTLSPGLRHFLTSKNELRRVFPQKLFHMLLSEAEVDVWDTGEGRGQTALFHLGALSSLITGLETPGWTSVHDYP